MRISDWSSDVCSSDLLSPINHPDVFDEIAVFQGASYFRSLGRGNLYGISARGLSIGTGGPQEEFPLFRTFWLEKPKPGAEAVQVHALLDSQSVTGAYHMTINPGATKVIYVRPRLFRSAEQKSELQSLMRIPHACLSSNQ